MPRSSAAALAQARETARIALAPRRALLGVPSSSIMISSILTWSEGSRPERASKISPSTLSTALDRSEEHTSELQSRQYLVCRLLLEKKNQTLRFAPYAAAC